MFFVIWFNMDEDLSIINSNTRNERIKSFFIQNKKKIIIICSLLVLLLIFFFSYKEYLKRDKIKISNLYHKTILEFSEDTKLKTIDSLVEVVNKKDPTYSPLSLYFILDNDLIKDRNEINKLFDIIIEKTSLGREIKNLIIYKKALYNADFIEENRLIEILNPIINSNSIWKAHSLFLIAEYFYSKNEKQKSKEFFEQIIDLVDANSNIKIEAQKRLIRDLSE